jgi:hypothetical protein
MKPWPHTKLSLSSLLIGYLVISLLTLVIYWADGALGLVDWALSTIVILFALAKSIGFVWANIRKIHQVTVEHTPFHRYLVFLVVSLSLVIYSFALDTYLIHSLVPGSYHGISASLTQAELLFECYYYSFLNLTIYGVVEIVPKTISAKLILIFQEALMFLTLIYILSDFISLRDSIRESLRKDTGSNL